MTEGNHADGKYTGEGWDLFGLAFLTGLLTLLTLGIYRFWGKTRIRRYIWSSTRLDGSSFEYTGTGLEKFLGFLLAVVFLAIYMGLIQIVLFYCGLTIIAEPQTPEQVIAQFAGFSVSALAVTPLIFFAIYRARRYKLARTRWRGIRFGMEKNAWGYAFRALGYWALTIGSAGLLLPLMTFRLEKYMTDRTWFGDARFVQQGKWTALYATMKHVLIGAALLLIGGIAIALTATEVASLTVLAVILLPIGIVWVAIGVISYRVQSFAYLAQNKMLGGKIAFHAHPSTKTVIVTYVLGSIMLSILFSIGVGIVSAVSMALMAGVSLDNPDPGNLYFDFGLFARFAPGLIVYMLVLIASGAGALGLIVQPIIRHYVTTLTVINIAALTEIQQRIADPGADAEGFADALDIGGAI